MNRTMQGLAVAVLCAGCSSPATPAPAAEVVATVRVAPVERRTLTEQLQVYGTVVSGPAGRQTLSVPYESHVLHILVRAGQQIDLGVPILEIEPSPDTALGVQQARAQAESAHATFDAVRQRFSHQLATNEEFEQAEEAARQADLSVQSLNLRGSARARTLNGSGPAVVSTVHVTEGGIVAAGDPLVDLDFRDHREARFGIEAEDVRSIAVDAVMDVSDMEVPPTGTVHASVRALSDAVDAETGLVDLFAALPTGAPFMLGQRVTGSVHIDGAHALVVPRAALLPVDDHLVVFTIHDGTAVSHVVRLGVETHDAVELVGADLAEGDQVVVSGVPALDDGVRVRIEGHR